VKLRKPLVVGARLLRTGTASAGAQESAISRGCNQSEIGLSLYCEGGAALPRGSEAYLEKLPLGEGITARRRSSGIIAKLAQIAVTGSGIGTPSMV
jgi:hypothetical protein